MDKPVLKRPTLAGPFGRSLITISMLMACAQIVISQDPPFQKTTVIYKMAGDTRIEADVYRAKDETKRPVVVWIHGGALVVGSRTSVPEHLRNACQREGFALVSLDYRLAPEVKLPAIVEDIDDAFVWLRDQGATQFHIDATRCVVAGDSAGGYLTLVAGTRLKPPPQGLVAYYPFTDLLDIDTPAFIDWQRKSFPLVRKEEAYQAVGEKVLTNTIGGSPTHNARNSFMPYVTQNGLWTKEIGGLDLRDRRRREMYSPVRNAKRDFPPTLLIHGTADRIVRHAESVAMATQLARLKVPHELISVRDADHGLARGDKQLVDDAHAKAAAFIKQRLSAPSKTKSVPTKGPAS